MTTDDREIVSAVHRALADRVGQDRFALWFGRGVRMEPSGTTLRIAAADRFRLDYLRRAFRAELLAVAQIVGGASWELEFVLDEAAAAPPDVLALPAAAVRAEGGEPPARGAAAVPGRPTLFRGPDAGRAAADPRDGAAARASSAAAPGENTAAGAAFRPVRRQFARLEDYVACQANRLAFSAAQAVADRPGTYTPLTFVGSTGSGKTHLLEGIWRRARENRVLRHVVYLSAEQFTSQFVSSLRQTGTPSFRHKCRDAELLLIDDVQFFAGKPTTVVELVHTIDALIRNGRQVVLAADRSVAELRAISPDLAARIGGGLVCPLEPADAEARRAILRQLAAGQGLAVPDDVLAWLAAQLAGDGRLLAGALHRLRAASEAHGQAIDLAFAQRELEELVGASRRPVRLPEIVDAVCDVFGVSREEVLSGSKAASVTPPRMLIMFLARKWTRAALTEISRSLGRKSHTTVISAEEKIAKWLQEDRSVSLSHGPMRLEDAIRRIEAQLRTG